ncbi:MAG: hypothetical protein E5299_00733 [Burkholderia gladioli]|nr:MAG: hypothetical protein E5299_00733 [Burkholderia gladioli]
MPKYNLTTVGSPRPVHVNVTASHQIYAKTLFLCIDKQIDVIDDDGAYDTKPSHAAIAA